MDDCLLFRKVWQDVDLLELFVQISSKNASISCNYYTSTAKIRDLINGLSVFVEKYKDCYCWSSGDDENMAAPSFSLRFIPKDNRGHVLIEVKADVDDGADDHKCCFLMHSELGLLITFNSNLANICNGPVGSDTSISY